MICPICEAEFRATGVTWLGAWRAQLVMEVAAIKAQGGAVGVPHN
jgi:hypothetical protein